MGRILRRAGAVRKKQDTPQKSAFFRKIGLHKQISKRILHVLPEGGELHHIQKDEPTTSDPHPPNAEVKSHQVPDTEVHTAADSSDSAPSPSLVIDTSYSSDQHCSLVDTSSTLPSPEVFREEQYVEHCPVDDDLTDWLLPIKNSTLLDLSHALTISMHQAPNLSSITDASTLLPENGSQRISSNRRPSELRDILKVRTPPARLVRKLTCLKKRVWFRSPLLSEKSKTQNSAASLKMKQEEARAPPPSRIRQNRETQTEEEENEEDEEEDEDEEEEDEEEEDEEKNEEEEEKNEEEDNKDEEDKKEEEDNEKEEEDEKDEEDEDEDEDEDKNGNPMGGVFFDFASDSEHERFFSKMRERCSKLKSAPMFPLTAVKTKPQKKTF